LFEKSEGEAVDFFSRPKLIDLDNTLIDSVAVYEKHEELAEMYGVSRRQHRRLLQIAVALYGIGKFSQMHMYDLCKCVCPDLPETILEGWQALWLSPRFFPDARAFLEALPREKNILLTTGYPETQRLKIHTHGLGYYFPTIHIVDSPKAMEIPAPPPETIYFDDSPREIDAMKTAYPYVFCVLVRKLPPWESQKTSALADAMFETLEEALKYFRT